MSNQPYVVPRWYVFTPEQKKENRQLEKKIMEAIIQDPEIGDATNVSVVVKKENNMPFIHLLGKLETEKERDRAHELADKNTPINFQVINEIVLY
jgi:hypothetical protein